jgi:hypothetical protein
MAIKLTLNDSHVILHEMHPGDAYGGHRNQPVQQRKAVKVSKGWIWTSGV